MRGNTISIHLAQGRTGQTGNLFQYDRGQRLLIHGCPLPETYQVHFSNEKLGRSKPMLGDATGVDIPDEYLQSGQDIHCWVYVVGDDHAETEYHGIIHVTPRSQPTDITPTPAQKTVIDRLIDTMEDTVEAAEAAKEAAEAAAETAAEDAKEAAESIIPPVVNKWLDDHPEATTTVDFSIAAKVFNTVADMVADTTLKNGDNVATCGYYDKYDNGGANYKVSSSHTGIFYIALGNGLYANRLSESGVLPAESIGIKAYAASTVNPDNTDMTRNVTLFNTAIYNGVYLLFGKGYFYFNSAVQLAHKNTYTIRGIAREVTHMIFPSSDGFYFSDPIYYNYYVIRGMHIKAYGHTIRCAENCLTVLDSHFEWLQLESETGDCFHAPNYNVAKYTSQGGSTVYDTCVQNCVFDFINASAPLGAAFCNIMGMYTYYQHLNFVSCKYAFRNCDGVVEQANNLGSQQDYYIYYDKTNSHSLRWTFINVNAEGLSKAFIYTEAQVAVPSGEDARKPETANIMTIERITAINSDWSLRGVESGHDVYPITVAGIQEISLINSNKLVIPSAYPSKYDTTAVKAHINVIRTEATILRYTGGPNINYVINNGSTVIKRFGDNENRINFTNQNNGGYNGWVNRNSQFFTELTAYRMFGGKSIDVWLTKASVTTTEQPSPPGEHAFCDVVVFDVDTAENKSLTNLCSADQSNYPGRIITLANLKTSLKNLTLRSCNGNRNFVSYSLSPDCGIGITLAPGEQITLITCLATNPSTGNKYMVWKPIGETWENNTKWLYDAITSKPVAEEFATFSDGWLNTSADLNFSNVQTPDVLTGSYGYKYAVIPCSQGDEFTIFHAVGNTADKRTWTFIKNDGYKLTYNSAALIDKEVVTAPENAAYLVVQSSVNSIVYKSN